MLRKSVEARGRQSKSKTIKSKAKKAKTTKVKATKMEAITSIKKKAPSLNKLMGKQEVSSFFTFVKKNELRERALKVLSAKMRANKIKESKARALAK